MAVVGGTVTLARAAFDEARAALAGVVEAMEAPASTRSMDEAVDRARAALARLDATPPDTGAGTAPPGAAGGPPGAGPSPYGPGHPDWPAGSDGRSWPLSRDGYLRWLAGRLEGYGNVYQEPIRSLAADGYLVVVNRSMSEGTRLTEEGRRALMAADASGRALGVP